MSEIKAGCAVHHKPLDEDWFVLGVNHRRGEICVAGWPPTITKIEDCELLHEPKRELKENEIEYRNKTFGHDWE